MTATFTPTMAEAQAIALCWLARYGGLPDVAILRSAVSHFHPLSCGWCEYPTGELMQILHHFNVSRDEAEDRRWEALPRRAKGEAIRLAQGTESAA